MNKSDPKRLHDPETLAAAMYRETAGPSGAAFPPSTEKAGVGGEVDAEETASDADALSEPDGAHSQPSTDKLGNPSP